MNNFIFSLIGKIINKNQPSPLQGYAIAILAVAIATILKILLTPIIQVESPFLLYFGAVMLSNLFGGWRAGVLATFLAALLSNNLFLSPTRALLAGNFGQMVRLGIFISEGLLITGIIWALKSVTQRLQLSQQILRQSEERHRLLVDTVQDYAIYMLDPNGYVTSWNQGAQRIKGYRADEIIGRHFSCFYSERDIQERLPELLLQEAATKGKAEREGWSIRKDGSRVWANVVITALRDEAENLQGFSNVTRDVTEHKQAQERLANINTILEQRVQKRTVELEQARNNILLAFHRLNGIIESTNDIIAALDLDFKLIAFNTAFKQEVIRVFGKEPKLGMSLLDAVAHLPIEQAKVRGLWGRALQGEEFTTIEEFGAPELERHYYEINFNSIKDENNQVIGACQTVRNVTSRIHNEEQIRNLNHELEERVIERTQALEAEIQERIKIEANLRESEDRFRTLADNISQLAWMADENGLLFWYNRRWFDYTGSTLEEMQGWGWQKVHHPDYLQKVNETFSHSINTGEPWEDTFPLRGKNGEFRWFLSRALPIRDEQGNIVRWFGTNTDIQDIKEVQDALRESNAILNAINTTTPTMIYAKDLAGRMLIANPAVLAVLDKSEAEVIGKTDFEYLPKPEQAEFIRVNDRQVIETGEVQVYEETVDIPIGRRNYLSTKSPYRDTKGNIIGLIGISIDITDRKQYEAALEAKNREIVTIFESISDAVVMLDLEWRYIYANDKAENFLGKTKDELIGNIIWELFPDTLNWPGYEYCHRAMAEQITIEYEEYHPNIEKWLEVRLYPSSEGLAIYFRDITDRKQAEDARVKSETHFRNLANSMPQIVWTANPDGKVDYYNQRVHEFSGFLQKPDGTWEWEPVLHPEDQQRTTEAWLHAIKTGEIYECEHRVKKIDGEFYWHLSRGIAVKDEQGRTAKWYGTATDIHAQKQYQAEREELLQREQAARTEAELASRLKDEFLATLSHELRTPMNAMLGWTSMLRTRKFSEATTARALETIERNTRMLNQLIEDILDVSRIIRGKVRLNLQPIKIMLAIEEAIETLKPTAEAKDIQIIVEPLPENDLKVMGDSHRLQQIVWNLLSNALKFTPNGGSVTVGLSKIDDGSGSYAQIQVSDTGIGIEEEFLPFVFDRFRQADGSITRSHGGLGLGLAIVRHLVELHGGKVEVHSLGVGQGATFKVNLPLVIDSNKARVHENTKEDEIQCYSDTLLLKDLQVLLVDDEPDARDLVTVILEAQGAKVTAVGSAKEALAALQKLQPDIIVSDIGMPEDDGYSLIRQIRKLPPEAGGQIPAIALTAYATPEDRNAAISAGFNRHIPKPVDPTALTMAIATNQI